MSYPFVKTDAGRSESRRPKQKSDCTVRALVHVLDQPYDEVYDLLMRNGRTSHRGFDIKKFLAQDASFEWISFPAERGKPRMNPPEFSRRYPVGRYIVRTAGHVHAVIDGVHHDTHITYDARCIYGAWRLVG